jgi:uncharacterized membrane protein YphA (DoxX/SURF4 family)
MSSQPARYGRIARLVLLLPVVLWLPGHVRAHERYVVDGRREMTLGEFFGAIVGDPLSLGLLAGGAGTVGAVVAGYLIVQPLRDDIAAFRLAMREYGEYVPWLLRISFGVPLIGAGFGGYFLSPAVGIELRVLQVGLGFLLLFGLATRVVALGTLLVYLIGVVSYPALLLQFDIVTGMVAVVLVGSGKPSADHVLYRVSEARGTMYGRVDFVHSWAREQQARLEPYTRLAPTVVRVGLGLTFVFLGVSEKLLSPGLGLAVVERYDLTAVIPVPAELWVFGAGLAEVTLGTLLVVGLFTRASALTAMVMFTLTLFALPDDPVLAHVGLYGLASVLLITGSGPYGLDRRLAAVVADWQDAFVDRDPKGAPDR